MNLVSRERYVSTDILRRINTRIAIEDLNIARDVQRNTFDGVNMSHRQDNIMVIDFTRQHLRSECGDKQLVRQI